MPAISIAPEAGRDAKAYFAVPVEEVWLEVGFGGGEHLLWQAENHPHAGVIGCEPYIAGAAKLLSKIAEDRRPNIRLYVDDARAVIEALPDASLSRVFILHPDPWPKTRHHKRRFIQMEMLDSLARIMKSGAELRFATDDPGYLAYAMERFAAHRSFEWLAQRPSDWQIRPSDWPQTRYEAKAIREGRICTYIRLVRV